MLLACSLASQAWTQLTPTTNPTTRRTGAMEFSLLNGGTLMYGGLQFGPTATLDETWLFNGVDWTQLTPTTTPPPRWGHRMVYDSRRARIVTFGGRSPTTTATANDTWEWDGTDWVQMAPANSPNARAFYSMVFDERRGVTVLYGTQSGSTFAGGDQTWEYDGTTWTQVVTATTPPGLETPAMAYDQGRGVTVMFGGWNGQSGTMYDTTWEYNGIDWTQRTPATSPSPRYRASCVYDQTRGRVLVYGGFASGSAATDTWEYDGNNWTQIATAGPARSTECYMAHNWVFGETVLFGGSGPTGVSNETWTFTAPTTAIAAPFGTACAGSAGTPSLTPTTTPVLNSNYTLDLDAYGLTTTAIVVHGLDNLQLAPGVYLPLDLGFASLGGCQLEVSLNATITQAVTGGAMTTIVPIPANPNLSGQELYSQCFVLDLLAPNGFGVMSNAVHAVLGQ